MFYINWYELKNEIQYLECLITYEKLQFVFYCIRSLVIDALFANVVQVKDRTINGYYGSHVMEYGDVGLSNNHLFLYLGTNPANDNISFVDESSLKLRSPSTAVNQRDADLIHFWDKVFFTCNVYSLSLISRVSVYFN